MVQLRIHDEPKANRLGYEEAFGDFVDLTSKINAAGTQEENRLAIINEILAQKRALAYDHEREGKQFHGAAIIHTKNGRWFLQSNIHLKNSELTRDCAEANAAVEARFVEGDKFEIADIWFMGGLANYKEGRQFVDNEGTRVPPCGSCLDVIYNNRTRVGPETVVHMLPLNDGTQKLLHGDVNDTRAEHEIEPNRVYSKKISYLLPHMSARLGDASGEVKSMMRKGYEWIHNPHNWIAIDNAMQQQALNGLKFIEEIGQTSEQRLEAINKVLMDSAKDYCLSSEHKPKTMTIAIVRDNNGNYYMGKHVVDGKMNATPSAEFKAISSMTSKSRDNRMTDLFIVNLDEKELAKLSGVPEDHSADVEVKMPDGATREILKKFSPRNGGASLVRDFFGDFMQPSTGFVHVFLPNDPTKDLFSPKKHVITMSVKDLLPFAYKDPKGMASTRN